MIGVGMLIRRHRDRHMTEGSEAVDQAATGPTRGQLRAKAKGLGVSTAGSKAELADRIAEHLASQGAVHDLEAAKTPSTEPDPGAGGDNPEALAPSEGEGDQPNPEDPEGEDDESDPDESEDTPATPGE